MNYIQYKCMESLLHRHVDAFGRCLTCLDFVEYRTCQNCDIADLDSTMLVGLDSCTIGRVWIH